jgi:hypothetical protein
MAEEQAGFISAPNTDPTAAPFSGADQLSSTPGHTPGVAGDSTDPISAYEAKLAKALAGDPAPTTAPVVPDPVATAAPQTPPPTAPAPKVEDDDDDAPGLLKKQRVRPRNEKEEEFLRLYRNNPDVPMPDLLRMAGLDGAPGNPPSDSDPSPTQTIPGSLAELNQEIDNLWEQHRVAIEDELEVGKGMEIANRIRDLERSRFDVQQAEAQASQNATAAWRAEEARLTPEYPLILERTDTLHHELAMKRINAIVASDPSLATDPRVVEQVCRSVYETLGEPPRSRKAPGVTPASINPPVPSPAPLDSRAPQPGGPSSGAVVTPGTSQQAVVARGLPKSGKLSAYNAMLAQV